MPVFAVCVFGATGYLALHHRNGIQDFLKLFRRESPDLLNAPLDPLPRPQHKSGSVRLCS
jgi:hypothetical protein